MSLILVAGAIANRPFKGGEAWHRLSWLQGLQRLGHEVHFVEQIDAAQCRDASGATVPFESSVNRRYFEDVTRAFGCGGRATLLLDDGEQTIGAKLPDLQALTERAELLVNISGHLRAESLLSRVRRRVFIDEDPGFTQYWSEQGVPGLNLEGHDAYFTLGENIGRPGCDIPTAGIAWRPTRPSTVLDEWPAVPSESRSFTTVASWRGPFGVLEAGGRTLGLKVHAFRSFIDLPARTDAAFEPALDIDAADAKDRALLESHGWHVIDPVTAAGTPEAYRGFIQGSGAEFSVAKGVYVETNSGWFSDRSVRYLASGKPVLLQDTGFGANYPTGEGLIAFRTLDEAVAGVESVLRDYERHSRAARALAETYFDSDIVLRRLLAESGA